MGKIIYKRGFATSVVRNIVFRGLSVRIVFVVLNLFHYLVMTRKSLSRYEFVISVRCSNKDDDNAQIKRLNIMVQDTV